MADEKDLDLLCYKKNGVALCFKKGGDALVFKVNPGKETTVTFAWGSDVKDLDILAYWDGAPDLTAGYTHGEGGTEDPYSISYSGDIRTADASEWCVIKMSPWGGGDARTFRVHFNVFGYDDESYPGSTCTVIASQEEGPTLIKRNQSASTGNGRAATTSDPCCVVTFDAKGTLTSLT